MDKINLYIKAKLRDKGVNKGEKEYESLITYVVEYKGKEDLEQEET
mgnify:CR=1 FL=1